MAGGKRSCRGTLQCGERLPKPCHHTHILELRTRRHRIRRELRHHSRDGRQPSGNGGIFVAEHQQTPSPRSSAQHPAGLQPLADSQSMRQPRGKDQHSQRPRHTHLQVHARMAEVVRRPQACRRRRQRRPSGGRLLCRFRQALQSRTCRTESPRHERRRGRSRIHTYGRSPRDAAPLGSARP